MTVLIPVAYATALTAALVSLIPGAAVVFAFFKSPQLRTLPQRLQFWPLLNQFCWGLMIVACILTTLTGNQTATSTAVFGLLNHFLCLVTIFWSGAVFIHLRSVLLRAAKHHQRYGPLRPLVIPPDYYSKTEWVFTFIVVILACVGVIFPLLSVVGVAELPTIDPRNVRPTGAATYLIWVTGTANLSYDLIAWRIAIFSGPALLVLLLNAAITLWAITFVWWRFNDDSALLKRITQRAGWFLFSYSLVWILFISEDLFLLHEDPNATQRDTIPLWLTVARALLFHLQGFFFAVTYAVQKWPHVRVVLPQRAADWLHKTGVVIATLWGAAAEVMSCGGACSPCPSSSPSSFPTKRNALGRFSSSASASLLVAGAGDSDTRRQRGAARARLLWPLIGGEKGDELTSPSVSGSVADRMDEAASFFSDDESTASTVVGGGGGDTSNHEQDRRSRASASTVRTVARSVLHSGVLDAWEIARDAADAIEGAAQGATTPSNKKNHSASKQAARQSNAGTTTTSGRGWTVKIFRRPGAPTGLQSPFGAAVACSPAANNNSSLRQGLLSAAADSVVTSGPEDGKKQQRSDENGLLLTKLSFSQPPPSEPKMPQPLTTPAASQSSPDKSSNSNAVSGASTAQPDTSSPIAIPGANAGFVLPAGSAAPKAAVAHPALAAALVPPPEATTTASPLPEASYPIASSDSGTDGEDGALMAVGRKARHVGLPPTTRASVRKGRRRYSDSEGGSSTSQDSSLVPEERRLRIRSSSSSSSERLRRPNASLPDTKPWLPRVPPKPKGKPADAFTSDASETSSDGAQSKRPPRPEQEPITGSMRLLVGKLEGCQSLPPAAIGAGAMPVAIQPQAFQPPKSYRQQHPLSASRLHAMGAVPVSGGAPSSAPRSASSLYLSSSPYRNNRGYMAMQAQPSSLPNASPYLGAVPLSPPSAPASAAVRGYGTTAAALRGLAQPPSAMAMATPGHHHGDASAPDEEDVLFMAAGMESLNPRVRRIPMPPPGLLYGANHSADHGGDLAFGSSSVPINTGIFKPKETDDGVGGPAAIFQPVRQHPVHIYHLGKGALYSGASTSSGALTTEGTEAVADVASSAPAGSLLLSDYFDGGSTTATAANRAVDDDADADRGRRKRSKRRRREKKAKAEPSTPEEDHELLPGGEGKGGEREEEDQGDGDDESSAALAPDVGLNDTIGSMENH